MILRIMLWSTIFVNILSKSSTQRIYPGNTLLEYFMNHLDIESYMRFFYNSDMSLETVSLQIHHVKLLFILLTCYFQPELITKYAGNCETHKITTKDGYLLTMFRIPRENPKGVILLQHPLTVNSRIYMTQSNNSLGKYLVSQYLYFPLTLVKGICSSFLFSHFCGFQKSLWNKNYKVK